MSTVRSKKKSKPQIPQASRVRKKSALKKGGKRWSPVKVVVIGADVSMSTISLGGIAETKDGKIRVGTASIRWTTGVDYFKRMKEAADASQNVVMELYADMKIMPELAQVHFAIEEAVSYGHIQRAMGQFTKQQIQISGAFMGGLLKWGFTNLYEIQNNQWRAMVAHDLGFTIHKSKWAPPELAKEFHCNERDVGKFRAKQWVKKFHPKWDKEWPDIIRQGKQGQIPRPLDSFAKGVQSDDRYEALAMAEFLWRDLKGELK